MQLGFGWTNGVILDLLDRYADSLQSGPGPFEPSPLQDSQHDEAAPLNGPPQRVPNVESASSGLIVSVVVMVCVLAGLGVAGGIW